MAQWDTKAKVAPYAGAWIEIHSETPFFSPSTVAPYAGAWIEIEKFLMSSDISLVAPYAGAWIEMYSCANGSFTAELRRTLRGCVD